MIRRLPLFLMLLLAFAAAAVRPVRAGQAKRPNLVIMLCDDLGYGDLGCYGHPVIRTPNLDRMAAEGARLTRCYSASPVCSPSRAGLFTGRNPNRLGIRDWIPQDSGIYLRTEETTLPELLKNAGYRTCLSGKWHLNSKMDGSEPDPGDHGFDHWFSTQNNAIPSHENPVNFVRNGKPAGPMQGNSSRLIADEAIEFARRNNESPFALFITFHAPHEPVATPEEWISRYRDKSLSEDQAIYYGSVSLVDEQVGRILREIDQIAGDEETLFVFTSDNGPETLNRYRTANRSYGSPGPLRGMKLHVTEAGYRVPGIVRWKGAIPPGSELDEPVCSLDLLPTLAGLLDLALPAGVELDGASLLPLLRGERPRRPHPLFWHYDRAISTPWKTSLLDDQWKLVGSEDLTHFELYHLRDDLNEQRDLSQEFPERAAAMELEMRRLHARIAAPR